MKKCFLYCTLAVVAIVACTRESNVSEEPDSSIKNGPISVTLKVGEPGTRTELTEENGEIHPWWSPGDGICVVSFPSGTSEFGVFDFDSALETAARTASFSGTLNEPGKYFAVYPQRKKTYNSNWGEYVNNPDFYSYSSNDEVDLCFTIPSVQHPSLTSFDPDADFLISEPFDIVENDFDETTGQIVVDGVSFTRLNAIVKIVLKPQANVLEGQTVRKVTIGTDDFSSEIGGEEPMYVARPTRATVLNSDEEDDYASHGLGGSMNFEFYPEEQRIYYNGRQSITAEYTDVTYQLGDKDAATYLVTFPGILKNQEWNDEESGESYVDGLHVRVETDEFVIDRNVVLPPNGVALQPSLVTTLNIKLYDDGVQGTTIQTIGMNLNKESVSMKPRKSLQLEAQFVGINPDSDDLEGLVWTSSDDAVVSVEPVSYYFGLGDEPEGGNIEYTNLANIKALSEGTATITATYHGQYVATCAVTVEIIPEQPSQMVDLGLPSGTKWSQWNVGAQSWDQEGDLYAWGETQYKDEFSWGDYKWAAGDEVLKKYTSSALFTPNHQIDNKFLLDLEDDAAYVNWGSEWYTPTKEQWDELRDNCSWDFVYDDDDNVIGCTATGVNGNSIYFPSRDRTYYFDSFPYMCSRLPLPDRGDWKFSLSFWSLNFDVNEAWSQELGNHMSVSMYLYSPQRGEDGAYVRPVSGGLTCRTEYTEEDLGAITLPSSDGRVKARFPVYESVREQSYKNDPQYYNYSASAVILYSTDPNIEPCNYYNGHVPSGDSGSYQNGKYIRFSLDDYKENQVCSFVPEGMTGTVYYRAYYYSTVMRSMYATNSVIVNEKWGVTRSVTIP